MPQELQPISTTQIIQEALVASAKNYCRKHLHNPEDPKKQYLYTEVNTFSAIASDIYTQLIARGYVIVKPHE